MLPFKCFECGEVEHFATKCSHKRSKKDMKSKDKTQKFRKAKVQKRWSYYSKEESDISDERSEKSSSVAEEERIECVLMALESKDE